jgi:NAD/NADP transhydrogenase alpha subunit
MKISVLKERRAGETRVAATPETVKKLVGLGHTVTIESGAGTVAGFPDSAFTEAGAAIAAGLGAVVAGKAADARAAAATAAAPLDAPAAELRSRGGSAPGPDGEGATAPLLFDDSAGE